MKVKLKKKQVRLNLALGIVWTGLGIAYFIVGNSPLLIGTFYILAGLTFLVQYVYDSKHHYLIIENGVLRINRFYSSKKSIRLDEIVEIKGTDSNYILKTASESIKIDPTLIDEASLLELSQCLRALDLPEHKNMFSKFKPLT